MHTVYKQRAQAHPDEVTRLAAELIKRREIARRQNQIPIIDSYALGPNLWLGSDPATTSVSTTLANLHSHLWALTMDRGDLDLLSRLLAMQALRRALLRESVLLRLLPERSDREEARWADLLVRAFHTPLPNQRECMADKLAVFLEDLRGSSGSLYETGSARHAIWDATLLRDQQFVALVSGDTNAQTRKRVFDGFNTPLLPEILVCTSVGQEGIDLHRHCRQVIHYDLAWNPAVMEQRTGRTDRIGSKVFREREVSTTHGPYLEIGVPFLAGTYDERMYEEVRVRAQVFEVLTGGSLNRDQVEGEDLRKGTEGISMRMEITPLPPTMVQDLRVALHVFR